jgi:tRNA threonylcarbamoyladenosine biosynthesis protein TsaE
VNNEPIEIISKSVAQTIELGRLIGQQLIGGEILALTGQLASGKTHFVKGLAQGLEVIDTTAVTSPTFTLINEYQGRLGLYHIDTYRLEGSRQLEALGFDEMCDCGAVVAIEWADKVQSLIDACNCIYINMIHKGATERIINLRNVPDYLKEKLCAANGLD